MTNPFILQECFSFVSVVNFHRNLRIKFAGSSQSVSLKMSVDKKEGFSDNIFGGGGGFQIVDLNEVSYKAELLQFVQLVALQGPYFDHLIGCNWLTQLATCPKVCHVCSTEISQASIAMGIRFQHHVLLHDMYAEYYKPCSRKFISQFPDGHAANTKTVFKYMERFRPTGSTLGTESKKNSR